MPGFFSYMKKVEKALNTKPPTPKKTSAKRTPKTEPRSFEIGITGESFPNDDGTSRQEILRRCRVGELVILIHVPCSQDIYAVKVCRSNGEQIGWIPQWASAEFAEFIKRNIRQDAEIAKILPGQYIGCRLKITRHDDLSWNEKAALRRL